MSTCTICFDFLGKDLSAAPCGHTFHRDCIFKWLKRKKECPNCKSTVTPRKLIKLHMAPEDIAVEILNDPSKLKELSNSALVGGTSRGTAGGTDDGPGPSSFEVARLREESNVLRDRLKRAEDAGAKLIDKLGANKKKESKLKQTIESNRLEILKKDDEIQVIKVDLFKRQRELNFCRKEYDRLRKLESTFHEVQELKDDPNMNRLEAQISSKTADQAVQVLKPQIVWLKKEYQRLKDDTQKEREHNSLDKQLLSDTLAELRDTVQRERKDKQKLVKKVNHYKDHYKKIKVQLEECKRSDSQSNKENTVPTESSQSVCPAPPSLKRPRPAPLHGDPAMTPTKTSERHSSDDTMAINTPADIPSLSAPGLTSFSEIELSNPASAPASKKPRLSQSASQLLPGGSGFRGQSSQFQKKNHFSASSSIFSKPSGARLSKGFNGRGSVSTFHHGMGNRRSIGGKAKRRKSKSAGLPGWLKS